MRLKLTREQKVAARFLSGFGMVQDRLESHQEGVERAITAMTSLGGTAWAIGGGGGDGDKLLNAMIRLEEAGDRLNEDAARFYDQFSEIEGFISEVQRRDAQAGKVLRLTYINGLSADQIADREDMGCSKKTVYEHMRRGLDLSFALLSEDSAR